MAGVSGRDCWLPHASDWHFDIPSRCSQSCTSTRAQSVLLRSGMFDRHAKQERYYHGYDMTKNSDNRSSKLLDVSNMVRVDSAGFEPPILKAHGTPQIHAACLLRSGHVASSLDRVRVLVPKPGQEPIQKRWLP